MGVRLEPGGFEFEILSQPPHHPVAMEVTALSLWKLYQAIQDECSATVDTPRKKPKRERHGIIWQGSQKAFNT